MENTYKTVNIRPTVVSTRKKRVHKQNNSDVNKIGQEIEQFELLSLWEKKFKNFNLRQYLMFYKKNIVFVSSVILL